MTDSQKITIPVEDEAVAGTFLTPNSKVPGVLFVHGWGGSQERDIARARGIAGLGCVCLTFDLRGHGCDRERQGRITREQSLQDMLTAYDRLIAHPHVDPDLIAVVGTSYGGYLAAILTGLRPVKWLALRVPALYRDEDWTVPKRELSRDDLMEYRNSRVLPRENRALGACAQFTGDVLLVQSEHDDYVPHATIMSFRAAFQKTHSLTHRIIDGADHGLSDEHSQQSYTSILTSWATEMVVGARLGRRAQTAAPAPEFRLA
jgi:hypothetical protein